MIRLAVEHIIWLYAGKEIRRKREKERDKETEVFDFWLDIDMPRKRDILQKRERERIKE